jgi:hypothetical protein
MPDTIHMQPAPGGLHFHVYFLFVPALIFVLLLTLLFRSQPRQFAASTQSEVVLGSHDGN